MGGGGALTKHGKVGSQGAFLALSEDDSSAFGLKIVATTSK